MSNFHLRDKTLTLKAKGLLTMMLSLPDDWNYTTRGLAAICKEGVDSIGAALKELESAGYIIRSRLRDAKGRITDTEYVIFEQPQKVLDAGAPDTAQPCTDNPDMEKPCPGKPAQINTNESKTYPFKTHESNPNLSKARMDGSDMMGQAAQSCEYRKYQKMRVQVQEQIDYDALVDPGNRSQLNEIVELMTETLCTGQKTLHIAGGTYDADVVKDRFSRINAHHIEYIFDSLSKKRTPVRSIKQYLLTTLFNVPVTIDNYYDAEVRHAGIV